LIALTVILVLVLQAARAPAAVLAGPLLAGLVFALGGLAWRPGPSLLLLSQAVIGCAIGSVMAPALADAALWSRGGAIMVAGLAPLLLGVLMSGFAARMTRMSSATVVWGLTPGGASAMIGLAAAAGADIQKVALFQYLRLLLAALTALLDGTGGGTAFVSCGDVPWSFAGLSMAGWNFVISLALAIISLLAAKRPKDARAPKS